MHSLYLVFQHCKSLVRYLHYEKHFELKECYRLCLEHKHMAKEGYIIVIIHK